MPRFLIVIAALALGFSLGWLTHGPTDRTVTLPGSVAASGPAAATPAEVPPRPSAPVEPASRATDSRDDRRAKIETLKWLRESGAPVHVQVFLGEEFNEGLAKMLGLNEAEKARLTQAAYSTKSQLEAARAATAVARQSPDGTALIVEVPALDVATSGAIYDRFRESLESTLGPDRVDILNELAGEALERSFDRFGLNAVRYEVTPPRSLDGTPSRFVEYKRHFVDATGSSTGWTTGRVLAGEMGKTDALLAKVLPPAFTAGASRP